MCMMFYVFLIWIHVYALAIHFMVHCGSALEPGASGRPYYCTSIWVRSWCNWRASFVDSKKKKETKDIIPATLSLLPLRGAAVGRAPTILPIDWFCTNFSSFSILHLFQPLGSWCKQTNNWSASCVCVLLCFIKPCVVAKHLKKKKECQSIWSVFLWTTLLLRTTSMCSCWRVSCVAASKSNPKPWWKHVPSFS